MRAFGDGPRLILDRSRNLGAYNRSQWVGRKTDVVQELTGTAATLEYVGNVASNGEEPLVRTLVGASHFLVRFIKIDHPSIAESIAVTIGGASDVARDIELLRERLAVELRDFFLLVEAILKLHSQSRRCMVSGFVSELLLDNNSRGIAIVLCGTATSLTTSRLLDNLFERLK